MAAPAQNKPPATESIIVAPIHRMSIAEIRSRLLETPANMETYAAIDILCEAFAGTLLAQEGIQKRISVDDGRLYVDWPAIDRYAGSVENGWDSHLPAGTAIVLRVAHALATGQLTPSTARVLAGSLAVAGRRQRPTKKTGE